MSSVRRLQPADVTAASAALSPSLRLVRRRHVWSAAEDDVLRADYGRRTAPDLARHLGRSTHSVRQRARTLGLAKPVQARIQWTPAADAVLREQYGDRTAADLARELGTTENAVFAHARTIGLAQTGINRPFTSDEDELLAELYGAIPIPALAQRLGRTYDSITNRMSLLGLTREQAVAHRYARDQDTIARLREENARLLARLATRAPVAPGGAERANATAAGSHGYATAMPPPDAAHAPSDDARRLAVLCGYRIGAISPAEAAVALGVPVERLGVELGKAAKRGLDVVRAALLEDA